MVLLDAIVVDGGLLAVMVLVGGALNTMFWLLKGPEAVVAQKTQAALELLIVGTLETFWFTVTVEPQYLHMST